MAKWADYLVSAVSYSPNREIIEAEVHEDLDGKIGRTETVDKITMSHNMRKGKTYITVFKTLNSWKRGQEIHLYSVNGHPYLRIDRNKVNMDHLGDIPDIDHNKKKDPPLTLTTPTGEKKTDLPPPPKPANTPKPELEPEPASENKKAEPSSPHGTLPAEGEVEIPFEDIQPDLAADTPMPEPEPEPEPPTVKEKPKGNTNQEFLEYERDYLRRLEEQKKQQEELADQTRSEQKKQQEAERQARLQREETARQKHKAQTSKPAETANLRGLLPAEGEIEIPFEQEQPPEATEGEIGHSEGQEMDFDDDDEDKDPTPDQLAKFEELERQLEDMIAQSEQADATSDHEESPPPDAPPSDQGRTEITSGPVRAAEEPEPKDTATRKQSEQIAALSDKINELEAALASSPKTDPAPREPEPETVRDIIEKFDEAFDEQVARLEKLEEHIGEIENYDVESVLLEKLHRQTNKLNSIEERIAGSQYATQEQLDRAAALERQIAKLEKKKARAEAASDVVAYCVRCKAKRNMSSPKAAKMKNGRPAMRGTCSVCGAGMFRIGSSKPKKEDDAPTKEQIDRVARLEKQIEDLERRQPRVSGYCVKCRSKRGMANPEQTAMKNGKPAIRGTCTVCGAKMFKIGKM